MTNRLARCLPIQRLLILWLLAGPLAVVTNGSARADDESAAFQAVISAQLDAFRRDDWPAAFGYASPAIRDQFGDPDQFRRMVMDGYLPVARPRIFEYEPATVVDGRPTQPVFVVGPDGIAHRALYFMEPQPDGGWLIDGCMLLPVPDRTT